VTLTLLVGGARSGKSRLAVDAAQRSGRPVVFVATGEPRDPEFAARIARHRSARPPGWGLVEEPVELLAAIESVPGGSCVVVDCLTLWVSNLLERGAAPDQVEADAARCAAAAAARAEPVVAVTNEVGLGIVPADPLARAYRDVLGGVNAIWAAAAARAWFVTAGRLLSLERVAEVIAE
jgi:adenosylcobinamide kinase/adenosylcobinamide-phosphate guanylyltransferase